MRQDSRRWSRMRAGPQAKAGGSIMLNLQSRSRILSLILPGVMALCMVPHSAFSQQLLGVQTRGQVVDSNNPGAAEAFQTTASASGTLSSITVYVDLSSTATRLVGGLYADANGRPGTRVTQGAPSAPLNGQWNQVAVTPVSVTAWRFAGHEQ